MGVSDLFVKSCMVEMACSIILKHVRVLCNSGNKSDSSGLCYGTNTVSGYVSALSLKCSSGTTDLLCSV